MASAAADHTVLQLIVVPECFLRIVTCCSVRHYSQGDHGRELLDIQADTPGSPWCDSDSDTQTQTLRLRQKAEFQLVDLAAPKRV